MYLKFYNSYQLMHIMCDKKIKGNFVTNAQKEDQEVKGRKEKLKMKGNSC